MSSKQTTLANCVSCPLAFTPWSSITGTESPRFEETRPVEDPGCRGLSPRPGCPPGTRDGESKITGEKVPGGYQRVRRRPARSSIARFYPAFRRNAGKAPGSRAARAERPSRGGGKSRNVVWAYILGHKNYSTFYPVIFDHGERVFSKCGYTHTRLDCAVYAKCEGS
jgi:hypothetical protein